MNSSNIVLAISPHTDDAELGAGATIARWVGEGKEIFYVALSTARKSIPQSLPADTMKTEAKQATKVLGIKEENLYIYDFEVRVFSKFRQEILDLLISLREQLKPSIVLLPSLKDTHQDHITVVEEGFRAFKHTTILSYELPWNLLSFAPSLFVSLKKEHLDRKIEAINCYKSQKQKNFTNEEFLRGWARMRGGQINCEYGEAFEIVRWIIR